MRTLAIEAQARRRAEGLTPADMATRLDVEVDDIARIEAGEPASPLATERLCAVCEIPVETILEGRPAGWLRHVTPVDDVHATTMSSAERAVMEAGWFVAPDVAAHDSHVGWTRRRFGIVRRTTPYVELLSLIFMLSTATALAAAALGTLFTVIQACSWAIDPSFDAMTQLSDFGHDTLVAYGFVACAAVAFLATVVTQKTFLPWYATDDSRWPARDGLRDVAFHLNDEGISILRRTKDGMTRQDVPANAFKAIRVAASKDHGLVPPSDERPTCLSEDHLTIHVRYQGGSVSMPWIPRSRDLEAVIRSWEAQIPPPAPTFDRTYEIELEPVLVGRQ